MTPWRGARCNAGRALCFVRRYPCRWGQHAFSSSIECKKKSESFVLDQLPERVGPPIVSSVSQAAVQPPTKPEPEWPPLAQNVLANMQKYSACLLLTRVGGFYEAPQLAADVGIKLATRKWAGQAIPMAGFPLFQLEKYLKVLVQEKSRLVAICEEFKEGDVFQRRVSRVVSPGTLIDERFLDPFSNNFILAISRSTERSFGLAWLDVSTSDFQTAICEDAKLVRDEIVRISPREVLVMQDAFADSESEIRDEYSFLTEAFDTVRASVCLLPALHESEKEAAAEALQIKCSRVERDAISMLTQYLKTRLMDHMQGLDIDTSENGRMPSNDQVMHIDAQTLSALEVRETTRDGSVRGSVISIIRRTVTQGGARLLTQWITQPSTNKNSIEARHSVVGLFLENAFLRKDLRTLLRSGIGDILRTLQRINLRRNDEQDLLEVRDFVRTTDAIRSRFQESRNKYPSDMGGWIEFDDMMAKLHSLHSLGERLGNAIDDRVIEKRILRREAMIEAEEVAHSGGMAPKDAVKPQTKRASRKKDGVEFKLEDPFWGEDFEHLIKPDSSPVLRAYTDDYNTLRRRARILENDLRTEFGEPLTLRFLLGQGHIVHVPSAKGIVHEDLVLAYKTKTTRTYYHTEWTKLGTKLQKLSARLTERENESLESLRQDVLRDTAVIRRNARLIDQMDVLLSFSQAAEDLDLVRPTIEDTHAFNIQGGRHLAVEMGLLEKQRMFTKNDLVLGTDANLHLITGPNMGGKSTFLRQNAIIVMLAQAGCFVPADSAQIGVVDRIFSRVGAKDDLFHNRSTFMVEMSETAEILRRATSRSFVIADEIGRGTNTTVGVSIAFATLYTMAMDIGCRALFATHYYELADIVESAASSDQESAKELARRTEFFCTKLEQFADGGLRYAHQVKPGVSRTSHGLDVARLADMPTDAILLASRTHTWLERNGHSRLSTEGLLESVLE